MAKKETKVLDIEEIRVSAKDGSANAGGYASRILKTLDENRRVVIKYIRSNDLDTKVSAILRIMARMVKENNEEFAKKEQILTTLPIKERVEIDGKTYSVLTIEFFKIATK